MAGTEEICTFIIEIIIPFDAFQLDLCDAFDQIPFILCHTDIPYRL